MKKRKKARKTADGRIIVESNAYGKHTRAKRGTYKEAKLNDALKTSSIILTKANIDGKLIKRELDQYLFNPAPRLLWQRLLSVIRAGYQGNETLLPEKFSGFDVYDEYKMSRLTYPQCSLSTDKQEIKIAVQWSKLPNFKRKFPDGYMFGAICIFCDPQNNRSESYVQYSERYSLIVTTGRCEFKFDTRPSNEYVLVFLVLNTTENNTLSNGAATSGFHCIGGKRLAVFRDELLDSKEVDTMTAL